MQKSLLYYREELGIARKLYSSDKKKFINALVYGLNGTAIRKADTKKFKGSLSLLNESLKSQQSIFKNKKDVRNNYPNLSWTYYIIGITKMKSGDLTGSISNLKSSLQMRKIIAKKDSDT